ncbi:MAG TPA: hypothetical protein VM686_09780 [Polyangiaceae bacterium]|nr:hypothetical protein [Polyangiaceae bacterium]
MAGVLGRLENWVLGEPTSELFASDLRVDTPNGVLSSLQRPTTVRMMVSGGDDKFGSVVYEHQDAASGQWSRSCLVYFADEGLIRLVYVQNAAITAPA